MRVCVYVYIQVLLGISWLMLRLVRCIGIHHVVKLHLRGQSLKIKNQLMKDFLQSSKATVNSVCQKLLFLLQISMQISRRPLQSTLHKHCSVERCRTFWKGECHSLALVKNIYIPWQYSSCGVSHSDEGCVYLYLPFQILSMAPSLLSKPSSLGNTCETSTWFTQGERSCVPSWGQGAQEEETLVPVLHRHLECPPAWCPEGFQWRTAQPPPCRTLPDAGDSVSFPLGTSGQRWTRE